MTTIETFPDRDAQARAAAEAVAAALAAAGPVSFVAAGGSTPAETYEHLAEMDLGWDRVTVTLGDDRWVDPRSPDSNVPLLRRRLLKGKAAGATFLPLKGRGDSPDADADAVEPAIAALMPFDAVLLGMGEDGHTASLFPGAPPPDPQKLCVGVAMSGLAPFVPRVTLTMTALLSARALFLVITGEAKRALVQRVLDDPDFDPPIAQALRRAATPTRVFWAL